MHKIIFCSLLTIGLIGLLLGSVGVAQEATQPVKIEAWVWSAGTAELMARLAATFNAAYPDYQLSIRGQPNDEYNTMLQTALQGGAGPDVFLVRINPMPTNFAKAGFLEPLENLVPILSKYDPSVFTALSYNGHIYAVPYTMVSYPVYYNVDIFNKYGLSVPKTWDEFINLCKTLKSKGVAPISMYHALWAYDEIVHSTIAASFLSDEWMKELVAGKVNYTDPAYVKTFSALKELVPYFTKGWQATTYADATAVFAKGKAAMLFDGNWRVPALHGLNKNLNFDVFVLPGPYTHIYWRMGSGWGFNASLKGKKREAAIAFMNFVAGPLANEILARDVGTMPAAPGVRLAQADPVSRKIRQLVNEYGVKIQFDRGGQFDFAQPSIGSILGKVTEGVLLGVLTPKAAAEQIQDTVNQQPK